MNSVWQNRQLIWRLAKNDFKQRYAGSYMGAFWALVQPIVTVILYYFVFEVVFGNRSQLLASGIDAPYVLWLTAGLVPWFYFSEAMIQGMQAFIEYHYLVKKVVFQIKVLPVIKILAASFVHIFFLCVLLIMYFIYGGKPSIYLLQLPYFSFCMFCLMLAISYITSSIVIFFRDLGQIVNIGMQVLMWATPILWDIGLLRGRMAGFAWLFKCNPIYYVVWGYRSALFEHRWFWQEIPMTLVFWGLTLLIFLMGRTIYRRLRPHFADVL